MLPILAGLAPVAGTLLFAAPLFAASSKIKGWQALLGGFLIFGALSTAAIGFWAWAMLPPIAAQPFRHGCRRAADVIKEE